MYTKSLQSCPTFCDFVDCSLPGSSVHGILQARIPGGLPRPPPGRSSCQSRVSYVSCIGRQITISATWEAPFLHHIDRIQVLEAVGLRSSFSCWVSAGAHFQLLEVSCIPCYRATSIFKPAMVRWIFLMLLFSTFLHLWPLDLDLKHFVIRSGIYRKIFFAISYLSWGPEGKNAEVVCYSLLQWTMFYQNSLPWPVPLGWPYMAWLIVSLLDKAVIHVISLVRKQRGIKEPLDESESREWKSWFKTQHSKKQDHGIWSQHFMANRWGNNGNSDRLYFLGLQNCCRWWLQPWK